MLSLGWYLGSVCSCVMLGHVVFHLASILLYSSRAVLHPQQSVHHTAMAPKRPAPVMAAPVEFDQIGAMAMGDEDIPTFSTSTNIIYLLAIYIYVCCV